MSKRNLSITIGIMAALAVTAVASGAVEKITLFQDYVEDGGGDGMAILSYVSGQNKTVVQVILSGLVANTQYVVVVEPCSDYILDDEYQASFDTTVNLTAGAQGELTTDSKGHLTIHETITPYPSSDPGDFTKNDVLVILFSEWNTTKKVRLLGENLANQNCP